MWCRLIEFLKSGMWEISFIKDLMTEKSEKGKEWGAELTAEERLRYERQLLIPGWGEAGQLRLKRATVGLIGAGGIGSPLLYYLTAVGIGRLVICDKDVVSITDLNRQILYGTEDLGHYKLEVAQEKLRRLNPSVNIEYRITELTAENVGEIFSGVDCLVDCLDNFPTRFIINEFVVRHRIPLVHGAVWGLEGRVTFIKAGETPCLRCIYEATPPESTTFPVVGVTTGITALIQAGEVIKFITGIGTLLKNKLLIIDVAKMQFEALTFARRADCPVCGVKE